MSDVSSSSSSKSMGVGGTSGPGPISIQLAATSSSSSPKCKRRRLVSDLMGDTSVTSSVQDRSLTAADDHLKNEAGGGGHQVAEVDGSNKFFVRSNNEGFQCRQSSVFDMLNDLEAKHSNDIATWKTDPDDGHESDDEHQPDDDDVETDGGQHLPSSKNSEVLMSIAPSAPLPSTVPAAPTAADAAAAAVFKVPIGLPLKRMSTSRNDSTPDYTVHPEKWTKYTLADVNDDCMSENANSAAAIDFLSGRWKVGSDYDDDGSGSSENDVIVDVCNDVNKDNDGNDVAAAIGIKHKWVKPEHVVGGRASTSKFTGGFKADADSTTKPSLPPPPLPPSVQLSFLNCTKRGYFTGDEEDHHHHHQNSDDDLPSEVRTDTDQDCTNGSAVLTFRPVRKRQRNLRSSAAATGPHQDVVAVESVADAKI